MQFAVSPITTVWPESLSSLTAGLIFFNYTQLMLWDYPSPTKRRWHFQRALLIPPRALPLKNNLISAETPCPYRFSLNAWEDLPENSMCVS